MGSDGERRAVGRGASFDWRPLENRGRTIDTARVPPLVPYDGHLPRVAPDAFVADTARLVGRVTLAPKSSVWYGAVLRADINRIDVGEAANVQDGTIVHLEDDHPCLIGPEVVVGHAVTLHGCTVEEGALIGIGATVLTGAVIGAGAIVGAGALVPEGMRVKSGTLVLGLPAREVRSVTAAEREEIRALARKYVRVAAAARRALQDGAKGG